ncbi:hypothetical protein EYF80_026406 [Liparis tanakae]|uniref:Uncharacterized protein n=1 Tax=Liparis tanakae TaxID=230148 RepID=A0A4Z2HEQ1_9TELE|nr:hypothetical protein EYF80_026406 [Liparis tanakae]
MSRPPKQPTHPYTVCTEHVRDAHTELISWQSRGPSVGRSRLPLRCTAAGWMGGAEGSAVTLLLSAVEAVSTYS